MSLRRRRSARLCSLASDKRCLRADPQRAERRPSLATPDFGLGRGDGVPRLGAREVVRVLLKAGLPCLISSQGSRFEADFALLREGAFSRLLLVDFCDRARVLWRAMAV